MKIRSGFVSNSSSSSFVVIGTRIPREELIQMGWYDDMEGNTDKVPDGISIYYDEEKDGWIVGSPLCKGQDWGLERAELDSAEISAVISDVQKKLNRPVKLMMGTRPT